jgi:hypothetical protein
MANEEARLELLHGYDPQEDEEEYDFGNMAAVMRRPIGGRAGDFRRRAPFETITSEVTPGLHRQFSITEERPAAFVFIAALLGLGLPNVDFEEVEQQISHIVPEEATPETHSIPLTPSTARPEWECSICREADREMLAVHPSGCHTFHYGCLEEWLWRSPSCPMCRASISPLLTIRK